MQNDPISNVQWVDRDLLIPNEYNPNIQQESEFKLLAISILKDGWTAPITVDENYKIIDGFHRYKLSGSNKEINKKYNNKVPIVMLLNKTNVEKTETTIRQNRARGTHFVLPMSDIIVQAFKEGKTIDYIMESYGMSKEEVTRLSLRGGILSNEVKNENDFSKSWKPKKK